MPVLLRFGWAKTAETPPASRMFLPKTSYCHPPNREFMFDWGSHQIRNNAEWSKVEFYKQETL